MSKRLQENYKEVLNTFKNTISNYITEFTLEQNIIDRISILVDIYVKVVDDYKFFKNDNINYAKYLYFFKSMTYKKTEIEQSLTDQMKINPNKKKVQKINKLFINIYNKFETNTIEFINIHFSNNKKKDKNNNKIECSICLETITCNTKIITNCNHCFHKKCLFRHIMHIHNEEQIGVCPLCRTEFS